MAWDMGLLLVDGPRRQGEAREFIVGWLRLFPRRPLTHAMHIHTDDLIQITRHAGVLPIQNGRQAKKKKLDCAVGLITN